MRKFILLGLAALATAALAVGTAAADSKSGRAENGTWRVTITNNDS